MTRGSETLGFFLSLWEYCSTNTLNISYKTKVTQNTIVTHIGFLGKRLLWLKLISTIGLAWVEIFVLHINPHYETSMGSRKLLWPTV